MKAKPKTAKVKPISRKGWVIRITDGNGLVHFPIFKWPTACEVARQDDNYNDLVPHLTVFATKAIARSKVDCAKKEAERDADSTCLTKLTRPYRIDIVRYTLKIG